MVVLGRAVASHLNLDPGAQPGSGSTDIAIDKVLKSHPVLGKLQELKLNRYIPVLDPKAPASFLLFFNVGEGKLDVQAGRHVKSKAVIDYLEEAQALRGKDRALQLKHYDRFLAHEEEQIAEDAFLEFARASAQELGTVSKWLKPERFRALLKNRKLDAERISLFALLLGSCGGAGDAEFLKGLLDQPGEEASDVLYGILAGYTMLRPREGWERATRIVSDAKSLFRDRYTVLRMARLFQDWKPIDFRKEIMQCYMAMLPAGDMADFAIEDLRKLKRWEYTADIIGLFGRPSHDVPVVKRAIVRYALCSPEPRATEFVREQRRKNAEWVNELEEDLSFDDPTPAKK